MNAYEIADAIDGTDAARILLGQSYRSYCNGSDLLVSVGLWDIDGQESDDYLTVRQILKNRP